jgi:hypothetical protein
MMQMTINVPDTLPAEFLKLRIQELEQNLISEAKFFADFMVWDETKYLLSTPANAVKLFKEHDISLGKAAELAKMNLAEFSEYVSQLGIPVVDFTEDELDAELDYLSS